MEWCSSLIKVWLRSCATVERRTADKRTVSARARQLNHRLKNRKSAIAGRREAERLEAAAKEERLRSPVSQIPNGQPLRSRTNGDGPSTVSPTSGFVAVNSKQPTTNGHAKVSDQEHGGHVSGRGVNGSSSQSASAATHAELLSKFQTSSERSFNAADYPSRRNSTNSRRSLGSKSKSKPIDADDFSLALNQSSSVPIPNTPSQLLPQAKASPAERLDDNGPYKADMMLRMEQLNRGDRVQPPCDRCRRLHMDCLKNLTACIGCTKKHAKCSWKDVEAQELKDHPFVPRVALEGKRKGGEDTEEHLASKAEKTKKDWSKEGQGVRDEELLGEDSDDDAVESMEIESMEDGAKRQSWRSPSAHTPDKDVALERQDRSPVPVSHAHPPADPPSPSLREQVDRAFGRAAGGAHSPQPAPPLQLPSASADAPPLAVGAPTSSPIPAPPQAHMRNSVDVDRHDRNGSDLDYKKTTTATTTATTTTTPPLDSRERIDLYQQLKAAAVEAESGVSDFSGRVSRDRKDRKDDALRVYTAASGPPGTMEDEDEDVGRRDGDGKGDVVGLGVGVGVAVGHAGGESGRCGEGDGGKREVL